MKIKIFGLFASQLHCQRVFKIDAHDGRPIIT